MFSIVVYVIVGLLVFLCGYLAGWVNCHRKIKVGAPSTSTNSQSMPFHTGYGDGNYNGFGV